MHKRNFLLLVSLFLFGCCNDNSHNISSSVGDSTINNGLTHQVTFKNGDIVIDTIEVSNNGDVSFHGEIPTKSSPISGYSFDFVAWDKELINIQSDLVVNATYQVIKDEELDDGDYVYRPIYDESISNLIGYEIRFYNNFEFDGTLVLPTTYNNLPILRIGEACFMDCLISNVTIPSTVRVIDAYAFNSCENLLELNFPDSCKVVYNAAIFYDNSLTNINLNKVEFIGEDNFHICPKLIDIAVSIDNPNFISQNHILYLKDLSALIKAPEHLASINICETTTTLLPESLSRLNEAIEVVVPASINNIPEKAFFESKVTQIELKGEISTIHDFAFAYCTNLKSILLPSELKEIKNRAFYHCESLININFSDTLETIGEFAFAYCYNLQEFHIPSSLTSIGYGALDEQEKLTRFIVDESNQTFKAFDECLYTSDYKTLLRVPQGKDSILFNQNVEIIGSGAFYKCQKFTSISLPNTITSIEDYAFYFVDNVYHMSIPDSVLTIDEAAFQNMESLIDIHLPTDLKIINKGLFENCPLLQEVNIPYGVVEIGDSAFANCINLPVLTISKNVKSFGKDTFAACNMLDYINYEGTVSDWNSIKNRDISGLSGDIEITYNYIIK